MTLSGVSVEGVRNLHHQKVDFLGDLTVVRGCNAQGKTSFLEAVYLLATTRSFRTRDPREVIAHDKSYLFVKGEVRKHPNPSLELSIGLGRERGERSLSVGQCDAKLAEYLALLPALALAGESIRSIAGSPAERRRFMDRATAAADPRHLFDLGEWRRALCHRNQLLRQGTPDTLLDPWDAVLAQVGQRVASRRREQMAAWQRELSAWPDLFPEGETVRLVYRESGSAGSQETSLLDRLHRRRPRDREEGTTSVGPHRDDFVVEAEGKDLLRFGSAGQVRAALAALTVTQARQVSRSRNGARPLLVLDDVDTDLDPGRLAAFFSATAREGQVIAATSKQDMAVPATALKLEIRDGQIRSAS